MLDILIMLFLTGTVVYAFGEARGNLQRAKMAEVAVAEKQSDFDKLLEQYTRQSFYLGVAEEQVRKLTQQVRTMSER